MIMGESNALKPMSNLKLYPSLDNIAESNLLGVTMSVKAHND